MITLRDIIDSTQRQLIQKQRALPLAQLKQRVESVDTQRRFFIEAIQSASGLAVIAEIKTASPSAGDIALDSDPIQIAQEYAAGGAAAISILTEPDYFKGNLDRIKEVRLAVELPILRKDFIIDEYQLYESKLFGADAILLIARLLSPAQLNDLYALAQKLQLDVLLEVHSQAELEVALHVALQCEPAMIGVNARNLDTMQIDSNVFAELIPRIPKSIVVIAESSIATTQDAEHVQALGARGVLVGTALMQHEDKVAAVKSFRLVEA